MQQRNVYIPNRGPHDYSDARNFGNLVFCTDGHLEKMDTTSMKEVLAEAMADSSPDDLVMIGSFTSICCIACSIMTHLHGELHLLIHTGSHYIERDILFYNVREQHAARTR